jgi:1,4-dihydroxy-2-naphthoyl-CoA hydrolase
MVDIWFSPITVDALNERNQGTLASLCNITFTKVEQDAVTAQMRISKELLQPNGIVHGGAYCVLAETVASTAANCCIDSHQWVCVGIDLNINYMHAMRQGTVVAIAKPFHFGRSTQVWGVEICDEKGKCISICRMTLAVLAR